MTIEDSDLVPADVPDPGRRNRLRALLLLALAALVAVAAVVAAITLSGNETTVSPAGPTVCRTQVALAFKTDDEMRTAEAKAREYKVVGADQYAQEPQQQVFERFRKIEPLGKVIRIEATPAILWVSAQPGYHLDQLALNLRYQLSLDQQQAEWQNPCDSPFTSRPAGPSSSR